MTKHEIVTLPDGTRRYSNYTKYTPVPEDERKYTRRKPDDPAAVRWYGEWILPLRLLPWELRAIPNTRPDDDAYLHMSKGRKCRCEVCKRPQADKWRKKWWRERGVRF